MLRRFAPTPHSTRVLIHNVEIEFHTDDVEIWQKNATVDLRLYWSWIAHVAVGKSNSRSRRPSPRFRSHHHFGAAFNDFYCGNRHSACTSSRTGEILGFLALPFPPHASSMNCCLPCLIGWEGLGLRSRASEQYVPYDSFVANNTAECFLQFAGLCFAASADADRSALAAADIGSATVRHMDAGEFHSRYGKRIGRRFRRRVSKYVSKYRGCRDSAGRASIDDGRPGAQLRLRPTCGDSDGSCRDSPKLLRALYSCRYSVLFGVR